MAKRFYRTDTSPDTLRAIWDRIHDLNDQLVAQDAIIRGQASTITQLQTTATTAARDARNALIESSLVTKVPVAPKSPIPGGGGGGPPPPGGGGQCGDQVGVCAGTPLSGALPSWLSTALIAAGQDPNSNCLNEALLGDAGVEAACNANDFTPQRDSGCSTRARLYHQGNHGLWDTFCGHPDASHVADYFVNLGVTYTDGTCGWGWS